MTEDTRECEFCQQPESDPPAMLDVCPTCWNTANSGSGWMQRALKAEADVASVTARVQQGAQEKVQPELIGERLGLSENLLVVPELPTPVTCCPDCGPNAAVDGDGCCVGCGAQAYPAIDALRFEIAAQHEQMLAAEATGEQVELRAIAAEAEVIQLEQRIEAAEAHAAALAPYCQHEEECPKRTGTRVEFTPGFTYRMEMLGTEVCACGLDALLRPNGAKATE